MQNKKQLLESLDIFIKATENVEERRRAEGIRLKIEGYSYRAIATKLAVQHHHVHRWVKTFEQNGLDGIKSRRRNAGKKRHIDRKAIVKLLSEEGCKSPRTLGIDSDHWSVPFFTILIRQKLGISISTSHLYRILNAEGFILVPEIF